MFKDTLLPCHFTTTVLAAFSGGNCQKKHNLGSAKLHNRCNQFSLRLVKALHLATSTARPQHAHESSTSSKLTADKPPLWLQLPAREVKKIKNFGSQQLGSHNICGCKCEVSVRKKNWSNSSRSRQWICHGLMELCFSQSGLGQA